MNTISSLFALFAIFACYGGVSAIGSSQSFTVQGRLICKGKPSEGTKIKVYDEGVVWDTDMGEMKTNANGEFRLTGTTTEMTDIDPKINIYHKCDWMGPCYRKFSIDLPQSYISNGQTPTKVYDIGTLNLQNEFPKESKDCMN